MELLEKRQMFKNLSKLNLDDLRVVQDMVSFHLLRPRNEAPLGVDVSSFNSELPSGYEHVFADIAACTNNYHADNDVSDKWPELADIKSGFTIKKTLSSGMPCDV